LDELARRDLAACKDSREVISDPNGRYYGIKIKEKSLIPDNSAQLGKTRFETWLTQSTGAAVAAK
jgi:hypothetical protein